MLVLGRKLKESVRLNTSDGPIDVTVLERNRGVTRLGITAPPEVKIARSEILPLPAEVVTDPPKAA